MQDRANAQVQIRDLSFQVTGGTQLGASPHVDCHGLRKLISALCTPGLVFAEFDDLELSYKGGKPNRGWSERFLYCAEEPRFSLPGDAHLEQMDYDMSCVLATAALMFSDTVSPCFHFDPQAGALSDTGSDTGSGSDSGSDSVADEHKQAADTRAAKGNEPTNVAEPATGSGPTHPDNVAPATGGGVPTTDDQLKMPIEEAALIGGGPLPHIPAEATLVDDVVLHVVNEYNNRLDARMSAQALTDSFLTSVQSRLRHLHKIDQVESAVVGKAKKQFGGLCVVAELSKECARVLDAFVCRIADVDGASPAAIRQLLYQPLNRSLWCKLKAFITEDEYSFVAKSGAVVQRTGGEQLAANEASLVIDAYSTLSGLKLIKYYLGVKKALRPQAGPTVTNIGHSYHTPQGENAKLDLLLSKGPTVYSSDLVSKPPRKWVKRSADVLLAMKELQDLGLGEFKPSGHGRRKSEFVKVDLDDPNVSEAGNAAKALEELKVDLELYKLHYKAGLGKVNATSPDSPSKNTRSAATVTAGKSQCQTATKRKVFASDASSSLEKRIKHTDLQDGEAVFEGGRGHHTAHKGGVFNGLAMKH